MSNVFKIGIAENKGQEIKEVEIIELIAGKGIKGDRFFHENNDSRAQLTLIESENIDNYNKKFNLNIPYLSFRRNIITKKIRLNNLINKKLKIGNVVLLGIDLCRPCKHLEGMLGQNNIIKEFLRSGGLRCQILESGSINLNEKINSI